MVLMNNGRRRTSNYNIVASWWADRWGLLATGDEEERGRLLKDLENWEADEVILRRILAWPSSSVESIHLSPEQAKQLTLIAEVPRLARDVMDDHEVDKEAQLFLYKRRRQIMNKAWRSISYFEKRCKKYGCLVDFQSLEKKIVELAVELRDAYLQAVKKLPKRNPYSRGGTIPIVYEHSASDCVDRARDILARIKKERWPGRGPTQLRNFFYQSTSQRKLFDRYPQLQQYPHPQLLVVGLFYFNVVNFFRFFMASEIIFEQESLYRRSCLLADSLYLHLRRDRSRPPKHQIAMSRVKGFSKRFCPALLPSSPSR